MGHKAVKFSNVERYIDWLTGNNVKVVNVQPIYYTYTDYDTKNVKLALNYLLVTYKNKNTKNKG